MALGNVFYFNPTCELAVANGSFSYQPPLLLQEMERDLSILPFIFCTSNDFVLTENKPSAKFIEMLSNNGFELPKFGSLSELEVLPNCSIKQITPWGWSPASHYKFSRLKEKCSPEFRKSPVYEWQKAHKTLYERSTSLSFLHKIIELSPDEYIISKELIGTECNSIQEVDLQLRKHKQLVIKAPLSSSGRGIQIIRKPVLDNARTQWISGVLKQQQYVVAEPFLQKVTDFSFQFNILSESEIEYLGISFFETNSNGQYQGTYLNADITQILDKSIQESLKAVAKIISEALKTSVYNTLYRGFIGIDGIIFKNENRLLIHPCVEVNCRTNMGILAKFLENKIHPESKGKFELFYGAPGQFITFVNQMASKNQLVLRDGKIFTGFLPLTLGNINTKYGAYILVGEPK